MVHDHEEAPRGAEVAERRAPVADAVRALQPTPAAVAVLGEAIHARAQPPRDGDALPRGAVERLDGHAGKQCGVDGALELVEGRR